MRDHCASFGVTRPKPGWYVHTRALFRHPVTFSLGGPFGLATSRMSAVTCCISLPWARLSLTFVVLSQQYRLRLLDTMAAAKNTERKSAYACRQGRHKQPHIQTYYRRPHKKKPSTHSSVLSVNLPAALSGQSISSVSTSWTKRFPHQSSYFVPSFSPFFRGFSKR